MNTPVNGYTLSEVLADAYPPERVKKVYLVHAVDKDGNPACNRVRRDSLSEYAHPKHTEPTCPACLKRWRAAKEQQP